MNPGVCRPVSLVIAAVALVIAATPQHLVAGFITTNRGRNFGSSSPDSTTVPINTSILRRAEALRTPATGVTGMTTSEADRRDEPETLMESTTSTSELEIKSETMCFGGRLVRCSHQSKSTKTSMVFSVFIPPAASSDTPAPALYYLSGLTCTDENFVQKAGAQRIAARRGVALIVPDTSPRGAGIEREDDGWDFGTGAGFYVDATEPGWKENYRMYQYITEELPAVVKVNFPAVDTSKASIFGHSMGGHGALVVAFRNPGQYRSVSAFSAICNPVDCPWGKKAFSGYLGKDEDSWREYDATELMKKHGPFPGLGKILLDQGSADNFLAGGQLKPEALVKACEEKGHSVEMRLQPGYDHSYFFISSFVEDHVNLHADRLLA